MNDPIRNQLWADVFARVKAEDKFACNPKHEADMAVRDYDARLASREEAPATPPAAIPAAPSEVTDDLLAFVEKIANGEVKDHLFSSLEDEASSLWHRATALLALARKL